MKKVFATKVKALVLALTIFGCSFACNERVVKAEESLNYNQVYNYTVRPDAPQTLSFQTPARGYFRVEITVTDVKDAKGKSVYGNYMTVMLNVDNETLMTALVGKNSGMKASKNYAYAPGKNATINVSCLKTVPWSYDYQVKVVNETPQYFEAEDNNTVDTANALKNKKTFSGILNKRHGDDDWYVFKAPKTGNYKFYVQNTDDSRTGDFFYAQGYTKKNKTDSKFKYTSIHAGKGWYYTKKIKLKKGKKYYIRISDALYDSIPYEIKVKKVK